MTQTPERVEIPEVDPWIGRIVDDRYRVEELLGEGGMGQVFVAEHMKLGKRVALKVIHEEFAGDGEVAARFAREAMASAQLDHPNVASAMDYGSLPEGGAYLVMQLVRGRSLMALVHEEGALPWQRACEIGAQVADALAAAHAVEIVHRDLKPDNVLLDARDDGSVLAKVLDFGIARVATDGMQKQPHAAPGKALTRVGTVMGTPGYMAPEQAMGETVDARADLYSLGVCLWEMVVGKQMYDTHDLTAIVTRQLTETPPPIRSLVADPTIPEAFEELVARLLGRTPADRPSTATEVRDTLRRLAYGTSMSGVSSASLPLHSPPASREDTGRAQTMLADASQSMNVGAVGAAGAAAAAGAAQTASSTAAQTASSATAPSDLAQRTSQIVEEAKKRPLLVAAGCAGLFVLGVVVLGIAFAIGGDEETPGAPVSSGAGGFSVGGILEPAVQQVVGPPAEVAARLETLTDDEDRRARLDAARWLLEHEPSSEVPAWGLAVAELERARGCRGKKRVLPRVVEIGDDEALPALERLHRTRRGCGFLGRSDCYGCLRADLREAIESLGGDLSDGNDG